MDGRLHRHLQAATKVSREDRVSITRWQLGLVASHQTCLKCKLHNGLSREHAVACSGAGEMLEPMWASIPVTRRADAPGRTVIDRLINEAATGMNQDRVVALVSAINTIEVQCWGRVRTVTEFWRSPAPVDGNG